MENYKGESLTEEQIRIAKERGTEAPFSGEYNDFKGDGVFRCLVCGTTLFDSKTKYNSGSGWPSFTDPAYEGVIKYIEDGSHGMRRVEVRCEKCDAHLGHVFPDGPGDSGERYCVNSSVLDFEERKDNNETL
jgi:peptide-methionine (R)-S-oxide reductase